MDRRHIDSLRQMLASWLAPQSSEIRETTSTVKTAMMGLAVSNATHPNRLFYTTLSTRLTLNN